MTLEERLRGVIAHLPIVLYQTHTLHGVELNEGSRGVERRSFVNLADVKGKRVLDLGCASGAESFWALEQGATEVLGLDLAPEHIAIAMRLREEYDHTPVRPFFRQWDLTRGVPAGIGEFHTVFAFALTQYINYRQVWDEVEGARVAYVEGGGDSTYTEASLTSARWAAKLITRTPGNRLRAFPDRPLFRLERK
jgi:hypothetical protein